MATGSNVSKRCRLLVTWFVAPVSWIQYSESRFVDAKSAVITEKKKDSESGVDASEAKFAPSFFEFFSAFEVHLCLLLHSDLIWPFLLK